MDRKRSLYPLKREPPELSRWIRAYIRNKSGSEGPPARKYAEEEFLRHSPEKAEARQGGIF